MKQQGYRFGSASLGAMPTTRRPAVEPVPRLAPKRRRAPAAPKPEALIALGLWAATLQRFPSAKEIAARFDTIDGATVYRWRNHLAAAMGLPDGPPPTPRGEGVPRSFR